MVPGLGFSPFLFAISSAISCPCIGLFDSKKRIRNPNIPLISQQKLRLSLENLLIFIMICWVCDIYKYTDYNISYIQYMQGDKEVNSNMGCGCYGWGSQRARSFLTKEE